MKTTRRIGCREALDHLFSYLDEQLSKGKRCRVKHHLLQCQACSDRATFEGQLKACLQGIGQRPVRAAFERRIKALLQTL